jgi:acyl-coenzyme A thioesterase PaaI-like protein
MQFKRLAISTLTNVSRILRESRRLSPYVERLSPRLNRTFLNYVSELAVPYEIGMGLTVLELADEQIEVCLPTRWRNQAGDDTLHSAALLTLAEHTGELFWTRHLDGRFVGRQLRHLESSFLRPARGDMRARLAMKESVREALLFDLRRHKSCDATLTVHILNGLDQVVAEVHTTWLLTQRPALQARQR